MPRTHLFNSIFFPYFSYFIGEVSWIFVPKGSKIRKTDIGDVQSVTPEDIDVEMIRNSNIKIGTSRNLRSVNERVVTPQELEFNLKNTVKK